MPSIGTNTVTVWKGILSNGQYGYQLYEQGGVAGYGVVFGGMKAQPQQITTITRIGTNEADYIAAANAYRTALRTALSCTDQFNILWNSVVVLGVTVTPSYDPLGWIATANWTLLIQSV